MPRAVITGAGGFVGRALQARLAAPAAALRLGVADWEPRLAACDFNGATVYHLAARVHSPRSPEAEFRRDNVDKSRALAQAAARGGARRLVFLSTLKVLGEESPGRGLREDDAAAPADAYARSKLAAEQALAEAAAHSGLSLCIVRSPLVYGAGAAGNLAALLRLADTPWPLPFGALDNRRSFVHVDDLARALAACGEDPAADGRCYLVAHRDAASTARLVALARARLRRPRRLFRVPAAALEAAAAALGQGAPMRRLTRSLEADPARIERELGWSAAVGLEAAVDELARAHREGRP